MSQYKALEYSSIIDALRWLAFDVEPVSKEDEKVLVSRNLRSPLNLSSTVVMSAVTLGKIRYGDKNFSSLKNDLTEDEIKLRKYIPDLEDLLKNYSIEISATILSKERFKQRKIKFISNGKDIFINCTNPERYEFGRVKLIDKGVSAYLQTTKFYDTQINFKQLKKARIQRSKDENSNIDLNDCQKRIKAIKDFLKNLDSIPQPDAIRAICEHFNKSNNNKGFAYNTLARYTKQFNNSDGSPKFPKAPQGNYRKQKNN